MQTKFTAIEKLISNFQRRPISTMATLMVVVVIVCYYVIKGTYEARIKEVTTEKKDCVDENKYLVYSLLEKNNIIEKKDQALREQKDSAKINDSLDSDYIKKAQPLINKILKH
ncbi:hypothetical protein [Elizabethkingia anophelis]|uniref:Uncharacterized protein n=1 Tax=Elizabethkingia anophelis TaxID=1117645 RepID=A0A494JC30_9FLAO|nr:hypothetical protein [Elizabethkingia anophelis]AQX52409.1 hypothetical protein AYC66_17765 [Elizabethkingia anophelis]MDV3583457.1 hypothetical protein [Elizabethkingia anophelis]MDV3888441.1 hypothetical protein [Elizabethkingia anophelis]OPB53406.1 hypothetical protein BAY09_10855 [Elizabethkingia anophelis]RBA33116.1 hypothetical protein DSC50_12670 [Elizabethkingia anophelis]